VLVHFVHIAHPPTGSLASRTGRVLEAWAPSPLKGGPDLLSVPVKVFWVAVIEIPVKIVPNPYR